MRTWLLLATLAASIAGCDCAICPRESWCDGDRVMRCKVDCGASQGKQQGFSNCVKKESFVDCAQTGRDELGVEQTCAAVTSGGSTYHHCVDKPATSCTRLDGKSPDGRSSSPLGCDERGNVVSCFGIGDGTGVLATSRCTRPATTCHFVETGYACVDSPKVACDPAQHPRCADETTVLYCPGSPDAGYYIARDTCIGTLRCMTDDAGVGRCRTAPFDGGATDAGSSDAGPSDGG